MPVNRIYLRKKELLIVVAPDADEEIIDALQASLETVVPYRQLVVTNADLEITVLSSEVPPPAEDDGGEGDEAEPVATPPDTGKSDKMETIYAEA